MQPSKNFPYKWLLAVFLTTLCALYIYINIWPQDSRHAVQGGFGHPGEQSAAGAGVTPAEAMEKSKLLAENKEAFIASVMDNDINGQYDGKGMRDLCATRKWDYSIIVSCERLEGGIGNVKNIVLTCLRYAMEAGAALVIPRIEVRDKDLIALETHMFKPLDTFFDTEFFFSTLTRDCPELKLIGSLDDLKNISSTKPIIDVEARQVSKDFVYRIVLKDPSKWYDDFHTWITAYLKIKKLPPPSPLAPIVVNIGRPLFEFPSTYDPPAFSKHFAKILRPPQNVRRLGAEVLYELSTQYGLSLDPSAGIQTGKFLGAHLRTEIDAFNAHYQNYDRQSSNYIIQAVRSKYDLIYVASGHRPDIVRLMNDCRDNHHINVTTKIDLLQGKPMLKELEGLSWDQQGMVDLEVLLRSSSFGGIDQSSFAWQIALTRGIQSKDTLPDRMSGLPDWREGQSYADEFSWVYGGTIVNSMLGAAIWP